MFKLPSCCAAWFLTGLDRYRSGPEVGDPAIKDDSQEVTELARPPDTGDCSGDGGSCPSPREVREGKRPRCRAGRAPPSFAGYLVTTSGKRRSYAHVGN